MEITIAHSPDSDDIFMYYAIKYGWVDTKDYKFKNIPLDIETLNQEALKNSFDVSAISFGAYPFIADEYALLRCGVSFGYGYGPKMVKKKNKKLKANFKLALSGKYTTNALLVRLYYPKARVKYYNFLEIEKAILNDEVDAGVLIHESILNFDSSLEVEKEVWDIWQELTQKNLPLPLGGMAIRRSIPLNRAIEIEDILTKGVEVANLRSKELIEKLTNDNLVRIKDQLLERYLNMYASNKSISMDKEQLEALKVLWSLGYKNGIYPYELNPYDYLIPKKYNSLRAL
ncbi:MAG: succinate--CoA ligase [Epsilonproteobacteria bacterium]|nr:succinate--CoA ligase [Campylobacterota bacterium]